MNCLLVSHLGTGSMPSGLAPAAHVQDFLCSSPNITGQRKQFLGFWNLTKCSYFCDNWLSMRKKEGLVLVTCLPNISMTFVILCVRVWERESKNSCVNRSPSLGEQQFWSYS